MKNSHKINRRNFSKLCMASVGGAALSTACNRMPYTSIANPSEKPLVPPRLEAGQRVALIAPSSYASEDKIQKALANLNGLGLKVVEGKYLREENGFMGGTDGERVEEIHSMFLRDDVDAIWCVRGGYGATRILDMLDYDLIRSHPKVLVGYSDITALHHAILTKSGLVTYHGPVGSSDFTSYSIQSIRAALFGAGSAYEIRPASQPAAGEEEFQVIHSGQARGRLVGGNLTLLASMCGTSYLPDLTGKIVFVEDVGEASYRIDRMLVQLIQAANLKQAAGLVFGNFTNCNPQEGSPDQSIREILYDHFSAIGIPVISGYSIGHIEQNSTLGIGLDATLDADQGWLSLG